MTTASVIIAPKAHDRATIDAHLGRPRNDHTAQINVRIFRELVFGHLMFRVLKALERLRFVVGRQEEPALDQPADHFEEAGRDLVGVLVE